MCCRLLWELETRSQLFQATSVSTQMTMVRTSADRRQKHLGLLTPLLVWAIDTTTINSTSTKSDARNTCRRCLRWHLCRVLKGSKHISGGWIDSPVDKQMDMRRCGVPVDERGFTRPYPLGSETQAWLPGRRTILLQDMSKYMWKKM